MSNDRWLSPKQVSEVLDISRYEVRALVDSNILPSRKTAGGHRRVRLSAVEAYKQRGGVTDVDA